MACDPLPLERAITRAVRRFRHLLSLPVLFTLSCGGSPDRAGPGESETIDIASVQGAGAKSAIADREVTVAGIVTGDFQDGDDDPDNDLGGFFLQSEAADGDPRTSDAVFVTDEDVGVDVAAGDVVEVTGVVAEVDGETRIDAAAVRVTGSGGNIVPVDLPLPAGEIVPDGDGAGMADLEAFEGMLVRLPTMTVIDAFNLERFGALTLSAVGRISQFTNSNPPDPDRYAFHQEFVARSTIVLDDGRLELAENAAPRYLFPIPDIPQRPLRLGDTVDDVVGVLRFARGSDRSGTATWRVVPVEPPRFRIGIPRPPSPARIGDVRVMSFNALNFFTSLDSGANVCGPRGDLRCRGADSAAELSRQRARLVAAITESGAHVVGLMEIENNASESITSIVDGLNASAESSSWDYVDTGTIGADAIRVGLIFDSSAVSRSGRFAILDSSVDDSFDDMRNRPALAQTFADASGGRMTVIVTHLKSKGSPCDDVGDPNVGDGQGNCNLTRTRAAFALADWASADPTGSGDPDVLIIGDLNAYLREDPLRALAESGFSNLIDRGVEADPYSYVFRGQHGALDHALVSRSLSPQVVAVNDWHINADEPPMLDYNLDFDRTPSFYRASDHDPIIIGMYLTPDQDITESEQ